LNKQQYGQKIKGVPGGEKQAVFLQYGGRSVVPVIPYAKQGYPVEGIQTGGNILDVDSRADTGTQDLFRGVDIHDLPVAAGHGGRCQDPGKKRIRITGFVRRRIGSMRISTGFFAGHAINTAMSENFLAIIVRG